MDLYIEYQNRKEQTRSCIRVSLCNWVMVGRAPLGDSSARSAWRITAVSLGFLVPGLRWPRAPWVVLGSGTPGGLCGLGSPFAPGGPGLPSVHTGFWKSLEVAVWPRWSGLPGVSLVVPGGPCALGKSGDTDLIHEGVPLYESIRGAVPIQNILGQEP